MWSELIITILVGAGSVGWNAASTAAACSQGTIMTGQGFAGVVVLVVVGSLIVVAHHRRRGVRWLETLAAAATVGISSLFLGILGIAIWAMAAGCTR